MEKVKASDTWLRAKRGDVRGALLLLWSEAWMQTPCGTLPDDDELVALLIDMPLATFKKHRGVLMRGWSLATDGRLYHETITNRVLSMLDKRASDAQRAANRRARAAGAQATPPEVPQESRVTPPGQPDDSPPSSTPSTKHQAPSTRRNTGESACALLPDVPPALVADYLEVRRAKKAGAFTQTALKGLEREAGRAGVTVERALQACCEFGWIGFNAQWFAERNRVSAGSSMPNRQEALEQRNRAVAARFLEKEEHATH